MYLTGAWRALPGSELSPTAPSKKTRIPISVQLFWEVQSMRVRSIGSLRTTEDSQGLEGLELHHVESSVRAQSYLSSAGGFVYVVKEQVDLRLRVSRDGRHLELAVLQQREVLLVTFELPSEEDKEEIASGNCCTGSCALVCDQRNRCKCKNHQVLTTQALRDLRRKGTNVIREHLFPLFSKNGRAIVTLLELLTAIVMLAVALPTFVGDLGGGDVPPTDAVRFAISILSLVLAGIDAALANRKCILCRRIVKPHNNDPQADSSEQDQGLMEESREKMSLLEKLDKYYSDLIRVTVAEVLIYPTVICNIIDNATGRTYEGDRSALENLAFARFILSVCWLIIHVYLFRLIVIGGTIVLLEKARRGKSEKQVTHEDSSNVKLWNNRGKLKLRRRARRGIALEVFFLFHVFGQMLTQGLMLVAIWSKVQCENPEVVDLGSGSGSGSGSSEQSVHISPFTWAMIVMGFLLPIAGTFTFFIPTYFWAQEFPIDFMVTMLSALKKRGVTKLKEGSKETVNKLACLLEQYESVLAGHKAHFCRKFFFPLRTPQLIVLSCIYDFFLLSFCILYMLGSTEGDFFFCPFGPHNATSSVTVECPPTRDCYLEVDDPSTTAKAWLLFAAVAVGLANIANVVVVLIGLFWMVLVPVLIYALPPVLCFFTPLIIVLYKLCYRKHCFS